MFCDEFFLAIKSEKKKKLDPSLFGKKQFVKKALNDSFGFWLILFFTLTVRLL